MLFSVYFFIQYFVSGVPTGAGRTIVMTGSAGGTVAKPSNQQQKYVIVTSRPNPPASVRNLFYSLFIVHRRFLGSFNICPVGTLVLILRIPIHDVP